MLNYNRDIMKKFYAQVAQAKEERRQNIRKYIDERGMTGKKVRRKSDGKLGYIDMTGELDIAFYPITKNGTKSLKQSGYLQTWQDSYDILDEYELCEE